MEARSSHPTIEDLLEESDWVWRLARSLVRDDQQADDVVQETWLTALRRPLRQAESSGARAAWLARVVRRAAARVARSSERRERRERVAARPDEVPAADRMFERESLRQTLVKEVLSLNEPYRTVLLLRYFDELSPGEVARKLGANRSTVRNRIKRGLEILRVRLDKGLRPDGRSWCLALVPFLPRSTVAKAALSGAVIMSTKNAVAAALGVAILTVGWWAWSGRNVPLAGAPATLAEPSEEPAESLRVPEDAKLRAVDEIVGVHEAVERREVAASAPPATSEAAVPARILGRCVAAESDEPLAGCTIALRKGSVNPLLEAFEEEVEWLDPEQVVTGLDGRFELEFVPVPRYGFDLEVSSEGRVSRTARWRPQELEQGRVEDFGDIELGEGYPVRGRVVDLEGAPVAGVSVSLRNLPLSIRDRAAASNTRWGGSDESGWFELNSPIPAGTWSLTASKRGVMPVSPDRVTVRDGVGSESVTVVVKRMRSISGIAVDELGAPVSGVQLKVVSSRAGPGPSRTASASTKEDGSFTIHAVDEQPGSVRIVASGALVDSDEQEGATCEWGATDVRIEVRRALTFELTVTELGSGAPVEDFVVACYPEGSQNSVQHQLRLQGHHSGGHVTVDRVRRGPSLLVVYPKDPELAPSEVIEFEAVEAPLAPIQVLVERMVERTVRVVTSAGDPLESSQVELIRPGSHLLEVGTMIADPRSGSLSMSSDPSLRFPRILSKSLTGADGEARLSTIMSASELSVRVSGAGHLPRVVNGVRFSAEADEPLEIVVPLGGAVVGLLRSEGYAHGTYHLSLQRMDGSAVLGSQSRMVPVDSDGRFETPSLSPGEYELLLGLDVKYRTDGGSVGGRITLEPALTTVTVEDERVEIEIDATILAPSTMQGRVFLDGLPSSDCRVFLERVGGNSVRLGQYVPDADGRFEAEGVPPGVYQVGIMVGDFKIRDGDRITEDDPLTVFSGRDIERSFQFEHRRLRLRILGSDGETPLADTEVDVVAGSSWNSARTHRTDAEGWLVLDPVPGRSMTVHCGDRKGGPVEFPAGEKEAEQDVVLR